jgi:hypothetical protein
MRSTGPARSAPPADLSGDCGVLSWERGASRRPMGSPSAKPVTQRYDLSAMPVERVVERQREHRVHSGRCER